MAGGPNNPSAGIRRDALARPLFERSGESVVNRLLSEVEIADEPNDGRDDTAIILAIKLFESRIRHR